MKKMIELTKNTGVPKARAPFYSFNSPETETLLDVLHMNDALELMRDFWKELENSDDICALIILH